MCSSKHRCRSHYSRACADAGAEANARSKYSRACADATAEFKSLCRCYSTSFVCRCSSKCARGRVCSIAQAYKTIWGLRHTRPFRHTTPQHPSAIQHHLGLRAARSGLRGGASGRGMRTGVGVRGCWGVGSRVRGRRYRRPSGFKPHTLNPKS